MPNGVPLPLPKWRAFDADGDPLAGGLLYTYEAGTSTPLETYSDEPMAVPNANPVVLDASGEATIFIPDGTLYKFVLKNASGVQQWAVDNVQVAAPAAAVVPTPVPAGAMFPYGGTSAPTGYLLCDGSAVNRVTYADLFAILGSTYGGGDGSTTFNIPDMRGRFAFGKASSGTGNSLGGTFGAVDHTHTGPSHTHAITGAVTGAPSATSNIQGGSGVDVGSSTHTHSLTGTTDAGGTAATGTGNPPALVFNFIVKT